MTIDEYRSFCETLWKQCGDVRVVHLTPASKIEFTEDILGDLVVAKNNDLPADHDYHEDFVGGVTVSSVVNHVTGSVAQIELSDRDVDWAEVDLVIGVP